MQEVFKNIAEYNPGKKSQVLTVFDDIITDMNNNKKFNLVVTELFIRIRKLNISIVFITQSYSNVPKEIRVNATHAFIMKMPNKKKLQLFVLNQSPGVDFKDSINIYKKYTAKLYFFG